MKDIIAFGEVLWDVIDGEPNIGGAPFNFAAQASRCGMQTALVSALGCDELGRRARETIRRERVDDTCVFDTALPTGTVDVSIVNGMPSYRINSPVAWDRIAFPDGIGLPEKPKALYFGTLASRDPVSATTLRRMLEAYAGVFAFFDVNLRQGFWSRETVMELASRATVIKMNDEELQVLGVSPEEMLVRFPLLRAIVVTCGGDGCDVIVRGEPEFHSSAIVSGGIVDTVGAGDAFSAAFLSTMLLGKSWHEAAEAGNRLGGIVVTQKGALG